MAYDRSSEAETRPQLSLQHWNLIENQTYKCISVDESNFDLAAHKTVLPSLSNWSHISIYKINDENIFYKYHLYFYMFNT